jgi:choline-sulfatase
MNPMRLDVFRRHPRPPWFPGLRAGLAFLAVLAGGIGAEEKPNVLLITVDTLRADHLGAYGYSRVETPNIDRLARSGARFERAIAHAPLTLPSHASILTGTLPPTHGVRNNGFRYPDSGPPTLADILKKAGYRTGAFVGAFPLDSRFGLGRGFEVYDDLYGSRNASRDLTFVERKADDVNAKALAWIESPRTERFFAWIHYFDPHAPYEPPAPYDAAYRGHEYDGEIAYTDAVIGRLLRRLDDRGLTDRTLIVLTADHGESLGEHEEATHGIFIYDATLRVPLVFSRQGTVPAGKVVQRPVGSIDIVPTILAVLGIPPPPSVQGASLLPAMQTAGETGGGETYIESLSGWLDRRWAPLQGIRSADWKFIDAPQPELYDLKSDPGERKNVISAHSDEAKRMRAALQKILRASPSPAAAKIKPAAMSPESREKLRALGYVAGKPASAPSGGPPDPKTMMALDGRFNAAVLASEAGRLEAADREFRDILGKQPDFVQAYEYAAYNLYKMGRLDDAIALLRKGLSLDLVTAPVLSRLGLYEQEAGRLEASASALEQAVSLEPNDAEAHNDLGVTLFKQGALERAAAEFERAIALSPNNAMAFNNLGNVRLGLKELAAAAEAYRKAVLLDPGLAAAHNGWGAAAYRSGAVEEALVHWEKAVELDGRMPDALYNLGRGYLRRDRKKDALKCFESFVRWAPASKYAKDLEEVKGVIERLKKEIGGLVPE